MTFRVLLATHNQGKVRELKNLLSMEGGEVLSLADFPALPPLEEKGSTLRENALAKAKKAVELTGYLALADDSGLEVDFLGGLPGVYSARFAGPAQNQLANNQKLLQLLKGVPLAQRTARFRSVIALVTPVGKCYTVEGKCAGLILEEARGEGGFGYDPLFYLPQLAKTMAELTLAEKNKISHRGRAWQKMMPLLDQVWRDIENEGK